MTKRAQSSIQIGIKVNISVRGPQPQAKLVACDQMPRPFQQNAQHLKGFFVELDSYALAAKLSLRYINLETSKPVLPHLGEGLHQRSLLVSVRRTIRNVVSGIARVNLKFITNGVPPK